MYGGEPACVPPAVGDRYCPGLALSFDAPKHQQQAADYTLMCAELLQRNVWVCPKCQGQELLAQPIVEQRIAAGLVPRRPNKGLMFPNAAQRAADAKGYSGRQWGGYQEAACSSSCEARGAQQQQWCCLSKAPLCG